MKLWTEFRERHIEGRPGRRKMRVSKGSQESYTPFSTGAVNMHRSFETQGLCSSPNVWVLTEYFLDLVTNSLLGVVSIRLCDLR